MTKPRQHLFAATSFCALLVAAAGTVQAAESEVAEVSGDRPDFTESTDTVAPGRLQLEAGYTVTEKAVPEGTLRTRSYPELLFRYGLTEAAELRLGLGGQTRMFDPAMADTVGHIVGRDDSLIGAKLRLYDDPKSPWKISVLVGVSMPTGSENTTSNHHDPELKLAWGRELSEQLSISGNLNWGFPMQEGGRQEEHGASVSLAAELSARVGAFFEFFAVDTGAAEGARARYADAGLVYKALPQLLLDLRYGLGLNDAADERFFGLGFVYQFGHR